jgi:hypothetical protein
MRLQKSDPIAPLHGFEIAGIGRQRLQICKLPQTVRFEIPLTIQPINE